MHTLRHCGETDDPRLAGDGADDDPGSGSSVGARGQTQHCRRRAHAGQPGHDLQIAAPEYSPEGTAIVVRGVKPGTTLCGVWLGNQKPGGLYRVEVVAAAGAPDAGPSKVDGGPEPALGDAGLPDASVPRAPGLGGLLP